MTEPGVQLRIMLTAQRQQWDNMRERMGIGYGTHHLTRDQKVQILEGHLANYGATVQKLEHPCTIFGFPSNDQLTEFVLAWMM